MSLLSYRVVRVSLVLGLLALGLEGCRGRVLEPAPRFSEGSCLKCVTDPNGSGSGGAYADSVETAAAVLHNAGLDSGLVALQDSAANGPLTSDEALAIAKPVAEEYLAARGISVPAGEWDHVNEVLQSYRNGEDIVTIYADPSLSPAAKDAARDLLHVVDPSDPKTYQEVKAAVDSLTQADANTLAGGERDAYLTSLGVGTGSAYYWDANFSSWNATLSYSTASCGWTILGADIAGALDGFVDSGGNWEVAAFRGLLASIVAAIAC